MPHSRVPTSTQIPRPYTAKIHSRIYLIFVYTLTMTTDSKEKADREESSGEKTGIMSKLPPWLSMAVRKPRVWKTWVRCMIATFATMILMLVQPCTSSPSPNRGSDVSTECPWPSSVLWSHHVSGKDSLPSTLMQDHSPIHGRWTVSDRNDHHDDWDSDGMGMGSSSYGRGATGAKSSPAVVAAAKGTGWVSCSARNGADGRYNAQYNIEQQCESIRVNG